MGAKPAIDRIMWKIRLTYIAGIILLIPEISYSQEQTVLAPDLIEQDLLQYIQNNYTPINVAGYDAARDLIYAEIDIVDGTISGIYSGFYIEMNGSYCSCDNAGDGCSEMNNFNDCQDSGGDWIIENDPSVEAFYKGLNIEHSWPQSLGAGSGNPKANMHHLFPSKANVNSSRGNDPFADIDDELTHKWYRQDEILLDIPAANIEEYAEKFNPENQPELETFEPREIQKGNTARAMFYFYAIYQNVAPQEFWDVQKSTLFLWHYQDPVDDTEYDRTFAIADYQDNLTNPFVLDSTLARRIWFYSEQSTNTQIMFEQAQFTVVEGSGEIAVPIQITNFSDEFSTGCTVIFNEGTTNNEDVDYNIQSVVFTAGIAQPQVIYIEILDDEEYEGEEYFTLSIQDVWGGSDDGAISGNPGTLTIFISDNDSPGLTITEVMINPAAVTDDNGEWFEVFNPGGEAMELHNWIIRDSGTDDYTISDYLQILSGEYFIFGRNDNTSANGGLSVDHEYSGIQLGNNGDELILVSPEGAISDSIGWDNGYLYPYSSGVSMSLLNPITDNSNPVSWQASSLNFGDGDYGTPGMENCFFPDGYDECGVCAGDGSSCSSVGDVNNDGLVNVVDVVLIVDHILTNGENSPINEEAADLNGDFQINIVDVVWLVNLILY